MARADEVIELENLLQRECRLLALKRPASHVGKCPQCEGLCCKSLRADAVELKFETIESEHARF